MVDDCIAPTGAANLPIELATIRWPWFRLGCGLTSCISRPAPVWAQGPRCWRFQDWVADTARSWVRVGSGIRGGDSRDPLRSQGNKILRPEASIRTGVPASAVRRSRLRRRRPRVDAGRAAGVARSSSRLHAAAPTLAAAHRRGRASRPCRSLPERLRHGDDASGQPRLGLKTLPGELRHVTSPDPDVVPVNRNHSDQAQRRLARAFPRADHAPRRGGSVQRLPVRTDARPALPGPTSARRAELSRAVRDWHVMTPRPRSRPGQDAVRGTPSARRARSRGGL